MELPSKSPDSDAVHRHSHRSTVDTSRPFSSVKEAVAVFGERILSGEIHSKPTSFLKKETPSFSSGVSDAIKRLETELEETKNEVRLLSERESLTQAAVASLDGELRKSMSQLSLAEGVTLAGGSDGAVIVSDDKRGSTPCLSEILSIGVRGRRRRNRVVKQKPVIPIVCDLFSRRKKGSIGGPQNPHILPSDSPFLWN